MELAEAVVGRAAGAEQAEPEGRAGPGAAEVPAEPGALEEREAVAVPEELAGLAAAEAREQRAVGVAQGQRLSTIRTIR